MHGVISNPHVPDEGDQDHTRASEDAPLEAETEENVRKVNSPVRQTEGKHPPLPPSTTANLTSQSGPSIELVMSEAQPRPPAFPSTSANAAIVQGP